MEWLLLPGTVLNALSLLHFPFMSILWHKCYYYPYLEKRKLRQSIIKMFTKSHTAPRGQSHNFGVKQLDDSRLLLAWNYLTYLYIQSNSTVSHTYLSLNKYLFNGSSIATLLSQVCNLYLLHFLLTGGSLYRSPT